MDIAKLLGSLTGYRTYLATAGTVLTSVATLVGAVDPIHGAAVIAVCLGLAQTFQRLATANATNIIGTLIDEVDRLQKLLGPAQPDVPPTPVPTPRPDVPPLDFGDSNKPFRGVMLVFCLIGGATCYAQDEVTIIGPSEVQAPGMPCELHLQGVGPDKKVAVSWKVFPSVANVRMIEASEGGQVARLTTIAGRWWVICAYHVEGEPIRFATHETSVPGVPYTPAPGPSPVPVPTPIPTPPAPVPGPGPNVDPSPTPKPPTPPPAPAPELPAGDFDRLPARVRDLAMSVNSPTRAAECAKLADALEGIAAQIAAGTLVGPQTIVNALGVALSGSVTPAWDDCRAKLVDSLKSLYMTGKLKTPAAWSAMLREVVSGLRAVK